MLPRRATVLRDGVPQQISADDLVIGDVVLLAEGDRVSADASLDSVATLAVDTSALTGESVPERPAVGDTVFAGCFVVEGEARATVTYTGAQTRLAAIAALSQAQRHAPTPLRVELARVSRLIAMVAIGVGMAFFAVAVLIGMPASDGFLFAVGVTVAVVPEGLLPTVTLSLAIGAQRMARHHALVRHLEAVETTRLHHVHLHRQNRNTHQERDVGPPVARLLGHTGPPAAGFAVAALAIPAVVFADAIYKRSVGSRYLGTTGPSGCHRSRRRVVG